MSVCHLFGMDATAFLSCAAGATHALKSRSAMWWQLQLAALYSCCWSPMARS